MAGKKGKGGGGPRTAGDGNWSRRNFAPVLMLSIAGKDATDLLRLCTSFHHKTALGKSAETKFIFRNDSRHLLDDERLFPNNTWKFRFGYYNDLSPIITGLVRNVEPVYDEKRTVTITLYDALLNMSATGKGKNWGKIPTSEIAKKLAKQYGFKEAIEDSKDTPSKSWIQPLDMNDIRYLRDLATLIDFEVFTEGTPATLVFRKKRYTQAPRGTLTYYDENTESSNVKSFKLKVKGLGPLAAAAVSTKDNKGDKSKNEDPSKQNPTMAVALNFSNSGGKSNAVIYQIPKKSDASKPAPKDANTNKLAQVARQQMLDKANEADSAHLLTPSITIGEIFTWRGIEKQVNGKWYATECNYKISGTSSGTDVSWKRNSTNGPGKNAANKNNNDKAGDDGKNKYLVQVGPSGQKIIPGNVAPPAPKAVGKK